MDCPVLVIDSSTNSFAEETTKRYGFQFIKISQNEFNHGFTREKGRKMLMTEVSVFLTQDVIPYSENFVQLLTEPLLSGQASAAYSKQSPKTGADLFEAAPRVFNYDDNSTLKSKSNVEKLGVFTSFISNSCAAWLNKDLDEIGGFQTTLTNEDYLAATKLIENGKSIAYVANSIVFHSHKYSLWKEFQRYFDTGYVRGINPWIQEVVGSANDRGAMLASFMWKECLKQTPWKLPYLFAVLTVKFLGYKIGFLGSKLPLKVKLFFSDQSYYWSSKFYLSQRK